MTNQIEVTECSICFEELLLELVTLECGHVFHRKWLVLINLSILNFENSQSSLKKCANCRFPYHYKTHLKLHIQSKYHILFIHNFPLTNL